MKLVSLLGTRSLTEIKFRLRQEVANLYLLLRQPISPVHDLTAGLDLPDPTGIINGLRGSSYAKALEALAEKILAHGFPLLGCEIQTAQELRWRRDYVNGKESGLAYFKRIPYLNFQVAGDHKFVWELNRHQHLVVLAQAYALTQKHKFADEVARELSSWRTQNPFQRGINWASALEVAFRTLSWIWVYHLIGDQLGPELGPELQQGLHQHGLHLAENLSVYFSPNTHLLGEAVALFTLATLIPEFREAARWAELSRRIVLEQSKAQVRADGSHFEQSTYYHVYALDFFLFFYVVAGRPPELVAILERMAEYLSFLLGPSREIDFFGDDDGGRLFHPYGSRRCFGRATLATCGVLFQRSEWMGTAEDLAEQAVWWLGADCLTLANPAPRGVSDTRFCKESGSVFVTAGVFHMQMDCGPFGFGSAGHSHSDTLSLTLRHRGQAVLVDPGTYTYVSDIEERNWFRGSAAHNTVRVDGRDQAESLSPFRWAGNPRVELLQFVQTAEGWLVDAACEYGQVRHRRRVLLNDWRVIVLDTVGGLEGEHVCEQVWQLGPGATSVWITTSTPSSLLKSAFSPAYGQKVEGQCRVATFRGALPVSMAMQITVSEQAPISVQEAVGIFEGLLQHL